jgi:predicted HicB family RNase H-like nuclease
VVDATRYSISIRKTTEDGETTFEGTVKELPDVAVYEDSYAKAYESAIDVIESLASAASEDQLPFPEPFEAEEEASGRFTLRMPKSLHARAARNAEREDISLNGYLVTLISHGMGIAEGMHTAWTAIQTAQAPHHLQQHGFYGSVDVIELTETALSGGYHLDTRATATGTVSENYNVTIAQVGSGRKAPPHPVVRGSPGVTGAQLTSWRRRHG